MKIPHQSQFDNTDRQEIDNKTKIPNNQFTQNHTIKEAVKTPFDNSKSFSEPIPHKWGEVIILVGTSSAGKSSIITELQKHKASFIENGIDKAGVNFMLSFFESRFPKEMKFFHTIFPNKIPGLILDYILMDDKPIFKEDAKPEEKAFFHEMAKKMKASFEKEYPEGAWKNIEDVLMDDILISAKNGQPIIFDILQIEGLVNHALFNDQKIKPKIALVYCSFENLARRIVNRNQEAVENGNLGDARPGIFPLKHFTKLFKPKENSEEAVVQKLTRKQAEDAFDLTFESGIKFLREHSPDRLQDRDIESEKMNEKNEILQQLGFAQGNDPDEIVELTPKYKGYDLLIDTASTNKPKAQMVQETVQNILFK